MGRHGRPFVSPVPSRRAAARRRRIAQNTFPDTFNDLNVHEVDQRPGGGAAMPKCDSFRRPEGRVFCGRINSAAKSRAVSRDISGRARIAPSARGEIRCAALFTPWAGASNRTPAGGGGRSGQRTL
jgi:hypothetical protein